MSKSFVDFFLS